MDKFGDLFIPALIGALVTWIVNFSFDRLKKKLDNTPAEVIESRRQAVLRYLWRRILPYLVIGAIAGVLAWLLISRLYQKTLWTFDQGSEGWAYLQNVPDASSNISWDPATQALRADFDFAQIDPATLLRDEEPRATFYIENLSDNWTGYQTLQIEVTNQTSEPLEISFSVFIDDCFYEFGGYKNLPRAPAKPTVTLDITKDRYKTCTSPSFFTNPLGPTEDIQRLNLIVGTNVRPASFKGAILIHNIILQKSNWFLWFWWIVFGGALFVFVFAVTFIIYLRGRRSN